MRLLDVHKKKNKNVQMGSRERVFARKTRAHERASLADGRARQASAATDVGRNVARKKALSFLFLFPFFLCILGMPISVHSVAMSPLRLLFSSSSSMNTPPPPPQLLLSPMLSSWN